MKGEFRKKYGDWAVVTGASSGIGRALCERFAKEGLNIVLAALPSSELEEASAIIEKHFGVKTKTAPFDLTKKEGCDALIEMSKTLDIGLFAACAGVETHGEVSEIAIDEQLDLLNINVRAPLILSCYFAREFKKRQRGGILLVASIVGQMPFPYLANYAGSKAFIQNFGLSLRYEMQNYGVDVSVLAPGLVDTPMAKQLTGVSDLSQLPVPITSMKLLETNVVKYFGKKALIIPDWRYRLMVFVTNRLMSVNMSIQQGGKIMHNAKSAVYGKDE